MAQADLLKGLQDWYASHCDGSWEHTYGISITNIDNPGWRFSVELTDTKLFDRAFDEVSVQHEDESDWYRCRVKNHVFEGFCGPNHLSDVISIFLNWANDNSET